MRKLFIVFLMLLYPISGAFAQPAPVLVDRGELFVAEGGDHWVALNKDYILEIVESYQETLAPQEWDSQMIIRAKLGQLPKIVKALRYLVSDKSKSTFKALKILGYTDTSPAELRPLVALELKQFEEIKKQLEAALQPEDDDSELE